MDLLMWRRGKDVLVGEVGDDLAEGKDWVD